MTRSRADRSISMRSRGIRIARRCSAGCRRPRLALTAISWVLWQYRAHANLRGLGRGHLDHRPWAIGWWFVPIANLWMPFKVVREVWKASEPAEDPVAWIGVRTWSVLGWWWAMWIREPPVAGGVRVRSRVDRSRHDQDGGPVAVGRVGGVRSWPRSSRWGSCARRHEDRRPSHPWSRRVPHRRAPAGAPPPRPDLG